VEWTGFVQCDDSNGRADGLNTLLVPGRNVLRQRRTQKKRQYKRSWKFSWKVEQMNERMGGKHVTKSVRQKG
jgi:hypothetical protein